MKEILKEALNFATSAGLEARNHGKLIVDECFENAIIVARDSEEIIIAVKQGPCFTVGLLTDPQNGCLKSILRDHVLVRRLSNILGIQ